MPAPWYRQAGAACPSEACCGQDAAALALQLGPEAGAASAGGVVSPPGPELLSEPMADVLEWLSHYDFREDPGSFTDKVLSATASQEALAPCEDDVGDEFVNEESTREDTELQVGSRMEPMQLKVPRHINAPLREPGRVLQPIPTSPALARVPARDAGLARRSEEEPWRGEPWRTVPAKEADFARHSEEEPPEGRAGADAAAAPAEPQGAPGLHSSSEELHLCPVPSGCTALHGAGHHARDFFEEEEEEWELRKRRSGTVGRLVVYRDGESPREDIVLRGGGRHHVVVAGLREGGQAAKVGVRAGDRLVSINGKKDFFGQPASSVQDSLASPLVLVFVGFVGKLQAEVRLARVDDVAGMPRHKLVLGLEGTEFQLCEERVFDLGSASLFLAVASPHGAGMDPMMEPAEEPAIGCDQPTGHSGVRPIFELQRYEASFLLKSAMRKLGKTPSAPSLLSPINEPPAFGLAPAIGSTLRV